MRVLCQWIICLLVFMTNVVYAAEKRDALTELSQLLSSFNTYTAEFSQKTLDGADRVLQKSSGLVMIKRPGKFRWVILSPSKQTLVTNGKLFWFYDVDLAQATEQKLSNKTQIDPASILSGSAADLAKNFSVSGLFVSQVSSSFLLLPKQDDYGFKKVILTFEDKRLSRLLIENNLSQISIFVFSKVRLNTALSDDLFNFQAPPGVDVVAQ